MKIGIRADVNDTVATGHFMRCATIADELIQKGADVEFYSADEGIASFAMERGFSYRILGSKWDDLETEIPKLDQMKDCKAILLDSYYITPIYMSLLKGLGSRIVYIDDIHKFHYSADVIVNYSPSHIQYDYKSEYEKEGVKLLLGTEYVPLRPQFSSYEDADHTGQDIRIFLTSGGMDRLNICEKIIRFIIGYKSYKGNLSKGLNIKIVLLAGRSFVITDYLKGLIGDGLLEIHQNVSDVASIMRSCDIGITPAGTTLYELCACKVSSISYTFADNQMADALYFDEKKLIAYCGDYRDGEDKFFDRLKVLMDDLIEMGFEQRKALGNRMNELIDGKGAKRITKAIMDL